MAISGGRITRSDDANELVRMLPKMATPSAPPIDLKNCNVEVATPSMRWSTAFWTAMVKTGKVTPSPSPMTIMLRTTTT